MFKMNFIEKEVFPFGAVWDSLMKMVTQCLARQLNWNRLDQAK